MARGNECIPFYDDGDELTGYATTAVTGKRFVAISGDKQGGAGSGGAFSVAPPAAGGRVFGVASYDAPVGGRTTIRRGNGLVVPVFAAAAITAGAEVQVDATGAVVPLAAGRAVGFVLTSAAINTDAMISLYN